MAITGTGTISNPFNSQDETFTFTAEGSFEVSTTPAATVPETERFKIDITETDTIIAGVEGKQIMLTNIVAVMTDDTTITITDEDDVALSGPMFIKAGGGFAPGLAPYPDGHFLAPTGKAIKIAMDPDTQVGGWGTYCEVDP